MPNQYPDNGVQAAPPKPQTILDSQLTQLETRINELRRHQDAFREVSLRLFDPRPRTENPDGSKVPAHIEAVQTATIEGRLKSINQELISIIIALGGLQEGLERAV